VSARAQVDVAWGAILLINGLGVAAIAYFDLGRYTFPERVMLDIFAAGLSIYGLVQVVRGVMMMRRSSAGTVADEQPPAAPDKPGNAQ
jgi:hypothetical protein